MAEKTVGEENGKAKVHRRRRRRGDVRQRAEAAAAPDTQKPATPESAAASELTVRALTEATTVPCAAQRGAPPSDHGYQVLQAGRQRARPLDGHRAPLDFLAPISFPARKSVASCTSPSDGGDDGQTRGAAQRGARDQELTVHARGFIRLPKVHELKVELTWAEVPLGDGGVRGGDGGQTRSAALLRCRGHMAASELTVGELTDVTTAPGGDDGALPGEATHRRRGRHRGAMQAARNRAEAAAASDTQKAATPPGAAECDAASPSDGGNGGETRGAALHGAREPWERELLELLFQEARQEAQQRAAASRLTVRELTAELASEEFKIDTEESWFRAVMMDTHTLW
ncbi:hypothetical protein T484DRAFT_1830771 [Baffinella frigidus]|nr:hypothetical protein T484DRAFT_1830771 [Cryptophyta sp. CCMP2293]